MHKIGYTIFIILTFIMNSYAQESTVFDYRMQKLDSVNYEMQLQLFDATNVQFIEIHFLEKGNELVMDVASLNQKKDGKFYLSCDGDEKIVSLNDITLNLSHEFGMLTDQAVMVKLLDEDFNLIDSYQKLIEEY